jgi:signal transduction histidine kinase
MDDETRMLVDTVNEDVTRIRAVANDFMQVSTVDLHSLRLKLDRLPISQLIQEWIKPFRVLARDRKVNLEFIKEGSETIWARADAIKLPWAISNLLANAIRVSEPGTTVTVYMTDRSDQAEIEIRDDGPGIPESVQSHMFEPYYQGPTSGPGASTGFLGLGLTIAKEVVEAHGGRIDYFARRPHGSTFRISIPYEIVYGGQPS